MAIKIKYRHEGRAIDYTPVAAVAAGNAVQVGDLIGVANVDIPANKKGALAVEGVFLFYYNPAGGFEPTLGQTVDFDFELQMIHAVGNPAADGVKLSIVAAPDTTNFMVLAKLNSGI